MKSLLYLTGGLLVLAALLSGCGPAATSPSPVAVQQAAQCKQPPARVLIQIDKSGSIPYFGICPPTEADLRGLIAALGDCGLELAVGPIVEDARRPLDRLRLDPVDPDFLHEPDRKAFSSSLKYAAALREHRDYHKARQAKVDDFMLSVSELLNAPADAPATELHGALRRAAVFLLESGQTWDKTPQTFAVIITDGIHSVEGSQSEPLPPGPTYIHVAGSADVNDMPHIEPPPFRFEGSEAALLFVTKTALED